MKKGIATIWISLFFSFLAVVLLLLFFFFFLRGSREPDTIAIQESFDTDAHNVLVTYLNAPVVVKGQVVTFSDLLRLWYNDKKEYESLLKSTTKDFLSRNAITAMNLEGKETKRTFWIRIEDLPVQPGQSRQLLLDINLPIYSKPNPGRATTYVPVSERRTVRMTMWNAETGP